MADHLSLWGASVEYWETWGVRYLWLGAAFGFAALVSTAASSIILYKTSSIAQVALDEKATEHSAAIAEFEKGAALLKLNVAESIERGERLKAANLELQRLMQPRRLPFPIFMSGEIPTTPPPGFKLYRQLAEYKGTPFFLLAVPDFESMKLAQDIAGALERAGWQQQSAAQPHVPAHLLSDGVTITTPFVQNLAENPRIREAASVLASGLLELGIKGPPGVGPFSSQNFSPGYRLKSDGTSVMRSYPTFDPPREVVVVLVGMRPIPAVSADPPK